MSNQPPVAAPTKLTPGELPLTLTVDVLRAPYPAATRLVLAEIVSLHAATGNCYCSDAHLAARLTLSLNTVSRAVQQIESDGLLIKQVDKAAGNHRLLVPVPATIKAFAAKNPYPQNEGSPTPKTGVAYPQNEGSPTPKMRDALPPEWGTNTTVNSTENLQEPSTPSEPEKKIGAGEFSEDSTPSLKAEVQIVPPVAEPPQEAPTKPAAPAVEPPRYSEASKALARKMASLWHITEQGNARKWMQLARFTHYMEQAGRLDELTKQFAGYSLYKEKRRIEPFNLDKYLGSEGDAYAGGEWCGCDWDSRAKATKADGDNSPPPPPLRASFNRIRNDNDKRPIT
jgi:biotin operon repressor